MELVDTIINMAQYKKDNLKMVNWMDTEDIYTIHFIMKDSF
jgi:hypothetical protein